ncbi:MAG: ATP-binding protein, partial [Dyadobacter sp.]
MPQFRAKARAVDLLGKGQIADLPTAISELWKNGYDAYGDKLEAFLYMKGYEGSTEPIFVLSDDGKGMNDGDILDKWFVLGTDSKSRPELDTKGPDTLGKDPRVKMGEKGIGRLAVAYLGPQMLMLTKKINCPLQVVFFDWRILSNYDLFISDINIPIRSISSLDQFEHAFQELKSEFLENFSSLPTKRDPWKDQKKIKDEIINDCNDLQIPRFLITERISKLLEEPVKSHGTQFIIFQPDNQLIELRDFIKTTDKDYTDSTSIIYTVSTLAGLFNQFKNELQEDYTHFWIYENSETGRYDLLTLRKFFSNEDFKDCDHLIQGEFNSSGEFNGEVRIYNKTIKHKFSPQIKEGKTKYGPFTLKVGYVQPVERESKLNPERRKVFEQKLALYGGMFIYRDGFRVLPYGRLDADFL